MSLFLWQNKSIQASHLPVGPLFEVNIILNFIGPENDKNQKKLYNFKDIQV